MVDIGSKCQYFNRKSLSGFYLQGLQIAFLRVTKQRGDAMVVPHTANVGLSPHREDLTDDGHSPQRAMNQLHYVCITHLLKMKTTGVYFNRSFPLFCEV